MAQTQNLPPAYAGHAGYPGAPHAQYEHSRQASLQANGQALQTIPSAQASGPTNYSGIRDNWRFSLVVEQQPVRARMCGFGDKVS
jgi:hypothetical protein